jgi:hypothetical protein
VQWRFDDILSDPYTTQQFIEDAVSMMPDFTGSFHYAITSPGNIGVSYGLGYYGYWGYRSGLHYSRVRFQLRWGEEMEQEDRYPVRYYVLFTPWDDPETEDVDESEFTEIITSLEINWSGNAAQSPVYTIDPGQIDPYRFGNYRLIEASLRPDYNRDGRINSSDLTWLKDNSEDNEWVPFHFWINDNSDTAEDDGNDVSGGGTPDHNRPGVQTVRDLIDFFPVAVNLPYVIRYQLRKPLEGEEESPRISLSFKGSAFNRIVYPDTFEGLTPTDAGKYLRDPELAREIAQMDTAALTSGSELSEHERDLIATGKTVFLFEGKQASTTPVELILEVTMPGGGKFEVPLKVQLSSVEDMYRQHNFLPSGGSPSRTGEPSGLPDRLLSDNNFVFVHGYNVNPTDARGWNAAMFKRLFWSGSRARFHGVQWHGYQSQLFGVTPNYHRNVINAFATAGDFANTFSNLSDGRLVVAGHSLGNILISSAIQDHGLNPAAYFMLNAAVAMEAYQPGLAADNDMIHNHWHEQGWSGNPHSRLWASRWHQLFANDGDARNSLTWRGRFEGVPGSTTVHNFFSSGEEVFQTHPVSESVPSVIGYAWSQIGETFLGRYSWAMQEKLKGETYTNSWGGSIYGGWGLNPQQWSTRERRISSGSSRRSGWGPWGSYQTDMSDEELKERPFFKPYALRLPFFGSPADVRNNLYSANGGSFVSQSNGGYRVSNRDRFLAKMIPAESLAVGGNPVGVFDEAPSSNFNMNSEDGMPAGGAWVVGRPDTSWLHSDLRNLAYVFTKKTFDQIVNRGEL